MCQEHQHSRQSPCLWLKTMETPAGTVSVFLRVRPQFKEESKGKACLHWFNDQELVTAPPETSNKNKYIYKVRLVISTAVPERQLLCGQYSLEFFLQN